MFFSNLIKMYFYITEKGFGADGCRFFYTDVFTVSKELETENSIIINFIMS